VNPKNQAANQSAKMVAHKLFEKILKILNKMLNPLASYLTLKPSRKFTDLKLFKPLDCKINLNNIQQNDVDKPQKSRPYPPGLRSGLYIDFFPKFAVARQ